MRLWSSLLSTKDLPQPTELKDAATRRFSTGPAYSQGPVYAPLNSMDVERAVTDQMKRVVWVYKAIDMRASHAASLTVEVKNGRGEDAQLIDKHALHRLLNYRANKFEDAWTFRYRLSTLLDLSPRGAFIEVLEGRGGDPDKLILLHPGWTVPVADPETFVSGFNMTVPGNDVVHLKPYKRGSGGVLWVKRPHPTDPYMSLTWLEAAGLSVEIDYYARLFNRSFMFNDGRPGGVLTLKPAANGDAQSVTPQEAEALQAKVQGGPQAAGRVAVWDGDVDYLDLSTTPRDAQYVESRSLSRDEILVAAGVYLSMIGDASARTYSNAEQEELNFWRGTMLPELGFLARAFEALTADNDDGDTEVVTFDLSAVAVLEKDKRERKKTLDADHEAGRITIDEWRKETGREPLDVAGTRVLWQGAGKAPIGKDEDVAALLAQGDAEDDSALTQAGALAQIGPGFTDAELDQFLVGAQGKASGPQGGQPANT